MQKPRLLLVEDDPAVRAAMASLLGSWQCDVVAADCTLTGLSLLRQLRKVARVVIADYHLPNGDCGTETVAAVRAQCGVKVPALLMSSDRGQHVREAARKAGIVLLMKPVAPSKLRATLNYLLSQAVALEESPQAAGFDLGRGPSIAADQRIIAS